MIELAAMMPVYNEAERYLEPVLRHLINFVDRIVVLDDCSTDPSGEICRSFEKVIYHRGAERLFDRDEPLLRTRLWQHTTALQPRWILAIDADEMFEERAEIEFRSLLRQNSFNAVDFRLFDFWNDSQYRVDRGWNPWVKHHRMLVKYDPALPARWCRSGLHCGRFPLEYYNLPYAFQSDFRVKHFGWMVPADRYKKSKFYLGKNAADPHAQSILDAEILLEDWIPCKTLPFEL